MDTNPYTRIYVGSDIIQQPVIITGTATTNASGVARFYLTSDRTSAGKDMFNTIYTWSADVESPSPATTRTMVVGVNYIEVTVTTLTFTGVVVLGISVLGSVTNTSVVGATIRFIIIGE